MAESISAAEANRQFSRLLRGVREEGATYIVTAHGRPVARIVPVDAADEVRAPTDLLDRLRNQPVAGASTWTRDELYEEKATGRRLNLEQLWQRARRFGAGHSSESAAIVRADRDARDRR